MQKLCCKLCLYLSVLSAPLFAENDAPASQTEQTTILFDPPAGWRMADMKAFPPSVKVMIVGKGEHALPPSISLGTEHFEGTLEEYMKLVKSINENQNREWKDLGSIRTQAGDGRLIQVDNKTEWGTIRLMQVLLIKDGNVYIMTSAALKEEFSKFYKDFFNSMRSLRFNK